MRAIFHKIQHRFHAFEAWFGSRFGWFFTNGMKQQRPTAPARQAGR